MKRQAVWLEHYEWAYVAESLERAATVNVADCTVTHVGRAELRRIAKTFRMASIPPTTADGGVEHG